MDLVVEPLASHHNRTAFSCGVPSLDVYLRQQAGQDMRRDLAVCYVLHDRGSAEIIGYYTLSATSIEPTALPPALAKRLGRYPVLPATLLGRLAVDARFTGQGMGGLLLLNAMRRTLHTGIGSLAIVVDALDGRAATFYERFEFRRFEDNRLRLYLLMSKVRDIFPGEGGP
jgi:GNAT superfamily N-acetyltransferase